MSGNVKRLTKTGKILNKKSKEVSKYKARLIINIKKD